MHIVYKEIYVKGGRGVIHNWDLFYKQFTDA